MSQNKEPRPRRTFTPELKQQIVDLFELEKENAILSENMILQIHSLINGLPRQITVDSVKEVWGKKYPYAISNWKQNWDVVRPFFGL